MKQFPMGAPLYDEILQHMGMSKLKRAQFFSAHPWCCFCGGSAPATTEDHIPSRAIFDSSNWPEGYSFPACDACNGLTRFDEIIIAMLSRILLIGVGVPTPIGAPSY